MGAGYAEGTVFSIYYNSSDIQPNASWLGKKMYQFSEKNLDKLREKNQGNPSDGHRIPEGQSYVY